MFYLVFIFALFVVILFPAWVTAGYFGMPIYSFLDFRSFVVTVFGSYLLVVSGTSNFIFFDNDNYMELWGDLSLKIGYICALFNLIFIFPNIDITGITSKAWGTACSISLVPILYGLIFKYTIITPWVTCKRNCK